MSIPFLKYPGGKRKLLHILSKNAPEEFNRYFEPFVGGGAFFFALDDIYHNHNKVPTHLNDSNKNIIEAYKNIKKNPKIVISKLKILQKEFKKKSTDQYRRNYYKNTVKKFNILTRKNNYGPIHTAYLIFLNRTGFNGMTRTNSSGDFNIPFGKYKHPKDLDTIVFEENLLNVSNSLKNVKLTAYDYKKTFKDARKGDFFYIDPPYTPIDPKRNSFTQYNINDFHSFDLARLRVDVEELNKKGCKIMISVDSNKYTKFLYKLWSKNSKNRFNLQEVRTVRTINSKVESRKNRVTELIVKNF